MKKTMELLRANEKVSAWKINTTNKESRELFFVKGRLETVRQTDTRDVLVTVYADHGECRGDAQFYLYPSTTEEEAAALIDAAADRALLSGNRRYELPAAAEGACAVDSNFGGYTLSALAEEIANAVFAADRVENAALNSLEIFVTRRVTTVENSRGLRKTQTSYDAMVEAIPTYNGAEQSVELYQQENFSHFDPAALSAAIGDKLQQARARCEAAVPASPPDCPVVLHKQELWQLLGAIARDLNYANVYGHTNLFHKGDAVQQQGSGDRLTIDMAGQAPGCVYSAAFDADGMDLGRITVVDDGVAVNYYGANRYGQYLGETPTGELRCLVVQPGSAGEADFAAPALEVLSMSGLQVDLFTDYVGGEVRLALWHDGEKQVPLTGISIAGSLSEVLRSIRLSGQVEAAEGYYGPHRAILTGMKVF